MTRLRKMIIDDHDHRYIFLDQRYNEMRVGWITPPESLLWQPSIKLGILGRLEHPNSNTLPIFLLPLNCPSFLT